MFSHFFCTVRRDAPDPQERLGAFPNHLLRAGDHVGKVGGQ